MGEMERERGREAGKRDRLLVSRPGGEYDISLPATRSSKRRAPFKSF